MYLYHILNLGIVKEKMLRLVSGSSSTEIKFAQLEEIRVPLPESGDFDLFLEDLQDRRNKVAMLRSSLEKEQENLARVFKSLYDPEGSEAA